MKCFSIDLDGTLLNSNHQIPAENYAVLKELKEKGHKVIINTGRAFEDVIKFDEMKALNLPVASINGTILYAEDQSILYEASLSPSLYKELLPILRDLGLWVMIYTNHGGFPCRHPQIQDKREEEIEPIFANYDYDQMFLREDLKIYKMMAVARKSELEKIAEARSVIEGKYEVSIASSHKNNVEFTSIDANKGEALLRYQRLTNVQFDEIFAFGDGGNDVAQFHVATTSVAMANAPLSVQKHADIVTKTNDENGFAYAVKNLLHL